MDVTAAQVLAFRLSAQDLVGAGLTDPLSALGAWTIQDSPPGAATTALLNRSGSGARPLATGWIEEAIADRTVISLYNARTATALLPADQAATYATGQLPEDDADFKALVRTSIPEQTSGYAEPVEVAVDAIADVLDGRALSRDDLHEELRQRLPKALLPWCEGCKSHHAKRGLLVVAGLHGKLCLSGRVGRQPEFSRTDQRIAWKAPATGDAQRQLLDHYLAAYGPSKSGDFAEWAGISKPLAKRIWAAAGDALVTVTVDGTAAGSIRSADRDRLRNPPAAEGVRLLGPGDPLLLGRDREALIPDAAVRKRLWSALPTTGLALVDGSPAALWKAKKAGKRLELTLSPIVAKPTLGRGKLKDALQAEAERLAPHRGCSSVTVTVA